MATCEHGYRYTDGTVADWCPHCMRVPTGNDEVMTMAPRKIKPGDRVWLLAQVDKKPTRFIDDDGAECDPTFAASAAVIWKATAKGTRLGNATRGSTPVMPDHPALIALERLLAEHGDALAAALERCMDDAWTASDFSENAKMQPGDVAVMTQLAAALGTEESGDGND